MTLALHLLFGMVLAMFMLWASAQWDPWLGEPA